LEARLAALISFYRWHGSVNNVPVAEKLLRGRPRRAAARGLLCHLDARNEAQPSSLVRVRTIKRSDRPPLLLPQQGAGDPRRLRSLRPAGRRMAGESA
jgi:hypothetical protein